MVNKSLVNYIQKYHSQGYSVSTLKNFLTKQGYSEIEVNEALNYAYTPDHHNKKMFITIAVIIGSIVFISLFLLLLSFFSGTNVDYDVNIYGNFVEVEKGQNFTFKIYVNNRGDDIPLSIRYELSNNGKLEKQLSDNFGSETKERIYSLRPSKLGNYVLTVHAVYGDYEKLDTFSFKVIPVCGDGICEKNEDCQKDCEIVQSNKDNSSEDILLKNETEIIEKKEKICGNNVCEIGEDFLNCGKDCVEPVCGNNKCEITENTYNCPKDCKTEKSLNELSEYHLIGYLKEELKKEKAAEVAKQCTSITDGKLKDTCFYYIVKYTNSSYYCSLIDNSNKKDDCYVSYSYNTNDYEKCSEIQDKYKKEHCDSLKITYSIQIAYS